MIETVQGRSWIGDRLAGWVLAGIAALTLHAGVTYFALFPFESLEPADDITGSLVVELAPMLTSSRVEPSSAPLGPQSSEQAESQSALTTTASATAVDTPVVAPTPVEPEPDLAFQIKEEKKADKPEITEPSTVEKKEQVSDASAPSVAAAPQKIDAPIAATPTAPEIGLSPLAVRAKTTWSKKIATHLERFKRYPDAARKQSSEGTVLVSFTVLRDGSIRDAKIVRASGLSLLDAAALEMLNRADPLPIAPNEVIGETFTFAVPIIFKVKNN